MVPSTVAEVTEQRPDRTDGRLGSADVEDSLLDPPAGLPPGIRRRLWLAGTDGGIRRLRLSLVALVVLGALGFVAVGANRPADPRLGPVTPRQPPAGFSETGFRVTDPTGQKTEGCAVAAAAEAQWQEGYMGKTSLPGYPGMIFAFPEPRDGAFFNKNVPIALDIAWFGADGAFVDSATMAPCLDSESCPLFAPKAPYQTALEVPAGRLAPLGAVAGSRLELTGDCPGA